MKRNKTQQLWSKVGVIIVLMLFLNMTTVSALQFSDIRAEEVTQESAKIRWNTDEAADSFVHYGTTADNLQSVGDARQVMEHELQISNLQPETEYLFDVQSGGEIDNNEGNLYPFTTLAPDTEAPELVVEIPEAVRADNIDIIARTEIGAEVSLFVNNGFTAKHSAVPAKVAEDEELPSGMVQFSNVALLENQPNILKIDVIDAAGNNVSWDGTVSSDVSRPRLELEEVPEVIDGNSIKLKGTLTETAAVEIFVNNRSMKKLDEVTALDEEIRLEEGNNVIRITTQDAAGWDTEQTINVIADSSPPRVDFELVKGYEYFEGRAETAVTGETEPEAELFLYVIQPGVNVEFNVKRAIASTTADEEGKFKFDEVKFPPSLRTRIEQMGPREVPPGLQDILVSRLQNIGEEQRRSYKVIIIAEDRTGKTGYKERSVNVNTCFTGNFAFDVSPHPDFPPMPFRLDPGLMEEGREAIQSVFEVRYRGSALGKTNTATGEVETGWKIQRIIPEKACTRQTAESDDYSVGCRLLGNIQATTNHDNTAFMISAALHPIADYVEQNEDLWTEFTDKRQLKFPLKFLIRYQERKVDGSWEAKTQPFCYDLGYFVDVPIESETLIPDPLIDVALPALNATINQIQIIKPYLETAVIVAGVGCVASFLGKLITKFYRFMMAGFEPWLTRNNDDGEKCPKTPKGRWELLRKDTITHWSELKETHADATKEGGFPELDESKSLDEICPKTAGAWTAEAVVDKFYQLTCDRFFCRDVPARWTENANEDQVKTIVARQSSCLATADCVPLVKMENCPESPARKGFSDVCYKHPTNELVYVKKPEPDNEALGLWTLTRYTEGTTEVGILSEPFLLAYQPDGSDQFCIAPSVRCSTKCRRTTGYRAAPDGHSKIGEGCYKEVTVKGKKTLQNKGGETILNLNKDNKDPYLPAGYTADCFRNKDNSTDDGLYQCVCKKDDEPPTPGGLREALKRDDVNKVSEDWIYRQAKIYEESSGTMGTHYPKWRYYDGRDFWGAFGLNWAFDNFKDDVKDMGSMSEARVNPHTQMISVFQAACLRGILARLTMLEQILIGIRDCLVQAKYTGFQDAGMCKTLFTQYFCSLIYKGIAYLASDCSPLSMKDVEKGGDVPKDENGVKAFFDSGFKAIPQAMESSINEVKSDYGDAQVNQFFSSGAEGFAESMCLFALGYDFPMGMDFIQDTVYSFSTEITPIFPIAEREMATIDPVRGNVVFNYNIGGSMWAGCKIRGYRVSLKCIDDNDISHPDVDRSCLGQGCDCLSATGSDPALLDEREKILPEGGSNLRGVERGKAYDFPIPSPQKISSNYRYDHVKLEIFTDQFEDLENCFDKGRRTDKGGVYYFPIREVKAPFQVSCHVDPTSGRFLCPQIRGIFGGSQTYIEHPFMRCYDKRKDEDVNCDLANVFVLSQDDDIVVKPYINMGGEKACLRLKDNKGLIDRMITLPENKQGLYSPRFVLGKVTSDLLGSGSIGRIVTQQGSDTGCGGNNGQVRVSKFPSSTSRAGPPREATFKFTSVSGGYNVEISGDNTLNVKQGIDYKVVGNILKYKEGDTLTASQINEAVFVTPEGFEFSQVFGDAKPKTAGQAAQCQYQIVPARQSGRAGNVGSLTLTATLYKPGPNENCDTTTTVMPRSNFGVPVHRQPIKLQADFMQDTATSGIHSEFIREKYEKVKELALSTVQEKKGDLNEVMALYYWIAAMIMQGSGSGTYDGSHNQEINNLLELFFIRKYSTEETLPPYDGTTVTGTEEYQKIREYLCVIASKTGYTNTAGQC